MNGHKSGGISRHFVMLPGDEVNRKKNIMKFVNRIIVAYFE